MQIDRALIEYNNRPLRVPGGAAQVQGTGARLAAGKPIDTKSPLYKQCIDFESIFVKMMLKEMRATVDKSADIIGGGFAGDMYQDMLDDEYAKTMSKTAHFGLADDLYRQLAK
ncbi:MAG: rod-binding protein [Treponema sp.]|nr:rod-binding protein [Treponema sp.]